MLSSYNSFNSSDKTFFNLNGYLWIQQKGQFGVRTLCRSLKFLWNQTQSSIYLKALFCLLVLSHVGTGSMKLSKMSLYAANWVPFTGTKGLVPTPEKLIQFFWQLLNPDPTIGLSGREIHHSREQILTSLESSYGVRYTASTFCSAVVRESNNFTDFSKNDQIHSLELHQSHTYGYYWAFTAFTPAVYLYIINVLIDIRNLLIENLPFRYSAGWWLWGKSP